MNKKIFIYEQFIEYLKKEEKYLNLNNKNLEKHHILPLHAGGLQNGQIILCTTKNHTLAHYYRFFSYGELGDLVAYKMRMGCIMSVQERSLLGVQKMKKNKINFFNPNWQSIQGSKKKKVKKTKTQIESCRKTGFNNKKYILTITLTKKTIWKYFVKSKTKFLYKTIEPQKSFQDIICILQTFSDNNNLDNKKVFDNSTLYKVVKGHRLNTYGWSLYFIYL